jgi:hypothetical protein
MVSVIQHEASMGMVCKHAVSRDNRDALCENTKSFHFLKRHQLDGFESGLKTMSVTLW